MPLTPAPRRRAARAAGQCRRWASCSLLLGLVLVWAGAAHASNYTYDALGRITQVTEADGSWIQYAYDANGNVTSITSSAAAGSGSVSISSFAPASGPVGTSVTIHGAGFAPVPAQNTVKFGSITASVSSASVTTLVATVPAGATTAPISVTDSNGTASSGSSFAVSAISISGFTPSIGGAGTTIAITGTGFDPTPANNTVKINSTTVSVSSASSTQLQITVPTGATSGHISVTNAAGTAVTTTDFIAPPTTVGVGSIVLQGQLGENSTGLVYSIETANTVGVAFFDGTQGQPTSVVFTNVSMGGTYTIYAPDGSVVATGGMVGQAIYLPSLPLTGTYSVYLAPATAVGAATIRVVTDATGLIPTTGGGVPTTLEAGQNASYTFNAAANQPYSLSLGGFVTNPANGYLTATILKPDGTTLVSCGTYQAGYGSCDFSTPAAGTYTIRLVPAGVYTIAFTLFFSADSTATLTAGTPLPVTLVAGQHGSYSFTATANATLALYFSALTGAPAGTPATVIVYGPGGAYVAQSTFSTTYSYTFNLLNLAAGTYTVLVTPSGNAAGSFQVTLANGATGSLPTNGSAVPVATTVPGQNGYFTFAGTAGQYLGLGITGVSVSPNTSPYVSVQILRPDGGYLTSTTCYTTSNPGCEVALSNLPQTGTYSVQVLAPGQATFSTTLWLSTDAGGSLVAGTPATLTLSAAGQDGRYTFTLGGAQAIALNVGSVVTNPAGGSVTIYIYDSNGNYLGNAAASASLSGTVNLPNLPAGTYSVLIVQGTASTGSMQVTLATGMGGPLPTTGATVTAASSVPGQSGYYTFAGTAGQNLGLGITGISVTPSTDSLYVYVYRPDGGYVTSTTCSASSVPGCTIGLRNLPQSGTYSVVLTPSGQSMINASLMLSTNVAATAAFNTPVSLNLCLPGESATLSFAATSGQNAAVGLGSVVTTPAGATVGLAVYDTNSNYVGGASASTASSGVVNLTNLSVGTYSVVITPPTNGAACTLQATVASGAGGPFVADGTTHAAATTVQGQNVYYTFTGTAGQNVAFGITGLTFAPTGSNSAYVYVYRPDGGMIVNTGCAATSTPGCQVTLQNLPQTGTYSITIVPTAQQTMSFSMTLSSDVGGTLTMGTPQGVTVASPGQAALLSFVATANQSVTLTVSSQVTVPASTPIYVNVYSPAGNQISSGSSATGSTLSLPSLAAGTYSVLVSPSNAATGSAQVKVQ